MPALATAAQQGEPAPKADRSSMESIIITLDTLDKWRIPPFQRPLRVNEKLLSAAKKIKVAEAIEGVVTLGRVGRDSTLYVVDGQHRAIFIRRLLQETGQKLKFPQPAWNAG